MADRIPQSTPNHATPPPESTTSAPDDANKFDVEENVALSAKSTTTGPPEWLSEAMKAMRTKYPRDIFEAVPRILDGSSSTSEWRIKCSDCPGKRYTPGPGETLSNFEIHLKNRVHRQRANERVNPSNS